MNNIPKEIREYIEKEQNEALKRTLGDDYVSKLPLDDESDIGFLKFINIYVNNKIKNKAARKKLKTELKNHFLNNKTEGTAFESKYHREILNYSKDLFLRANPEFDKTKLPYLATLYSNEICAEISMEIGVPVIFFYGELFMANLLFSKLYALCMPFSFDENTELHFDIRLIPILSRSQAHLDKAYDLLWNTINRKPHKAKSYLIKDDIIEFIGYQLLESILLFIFSHEMGHFVKNHFDKEEKTEEENWKDEYEADEYASELIINNFHESGYVMLLVGPVVFFHYLILLEKIEISNETEESHPPSISRLNKYTEFVSKKLSGEEKRVFENHLIMINHILGIFSPMASKIIKDKQK